MDEHDPCSSRQQAYQPYQIKKPQNLQGKQQMGVQPAKDSATTRPAKSGRPKNMNNLSPEVDFTALIPTSGNVDNESTRRNKLKLFPQKQQHISRFQGARQGSSSLSRLQQPYNTHSEDHFGSAGARPSKDDHSSGSNGMFVNNLVQQLE